MTEIINEHTTLNNYYNVKNSTLLANDLINLKVTDKHKLITFDIKDLYVNIPIQETINITKDMLQRNNDPQTTHQILTLLKLILEQNYFRFQQQTFKPNQGVTMGSPISRLIAEIFLQYNENKHIKQILDTKHIAFYTRYVDDILVIYDSTRLSPQDIHTYINGIPQNIKLKATPEENSSIDFLDLTITRNHNRLQIDIYRKPTNTDTTINFQSNHPTEHKIAAYRHHINRMYTLPLDQDKRQRERETIKTMGKNNNVPSQVLHNLHHRLKYKKPRPKPETADSNKWTTFTYHSPKIRAFTNLLKNTNISIAFRPATTTEKFLRHKTLHTTPEYDRSGIYTISCKTCQKAYVGQTSRS